MVRKQTGSSQLGHERFLVRVGHDEPPHLHRVHEEDPERDGGQAAEAALGVLRQQVDDREHELADDEEVGEVLPVAAVVVVVEDRFLGNVRVPDEQELAEGEVGPEDGEAEKELAREVVVLVVQAREVALPLQPPGQHDDRGHGGLRADGEVVGAKEARGPAPVETHEPVEPGEGLHQRPEHHEEVGVIMELEGPGRAAVGVLLHRAMAVPERDGDEEGEVEEDADVEEGDVEISRPQREFVVAAAEQVEPLPDRVAQRSHEEDRQIENKQRREKRAEVFPDAADEDVPRAVADVMEQRPEQGTGADGEEEVEGEEPGEGKLLRVEDRAEERQHAADDGDDQEQPAEQAELGGGRALGRGQSQDVAVVAHGWASGGGNLDGINGIPKFMEGERMSS